MPQSVLICYALAFAVALAVGLLATRVVRQLARQIGFVDKPDGGRKKQLTAVALGGGVAVYIALLAGVGVSFAVAYAYGVDLLNLKNFATDRRVFAGLLLASAWIVGVGIIDDRYGMKGRYKLLAQFAAAGLMLYCGLRIERFGIFGQQIEFADWLSIPVTLVWLIVTINAINLIDGIDGLAASVGTVLCLTVGAMTAIMGHYAEGFIVVALAGAQLGFLRYNFAPASIYLGDTGSMLIGLVVGVIATHTSVKSPAAMAMAVPLAVWSVPILDSAAAILRRKLTGRSLFAPDRGHLHHSLLIRGWSVRQAAMFVTLICATTCLAALLAILWQMDWIALAIIGAVVLFLISTKTFGHIELALLKNRFRNSAAALRGGKRDSSSDNHGAVRLQGSREWDKLWVAMIDLADEQGLAQMKLAINIPALHEVFYATWKSPAKGEFDSELLWSVAHPLVIDGVKVGQLILEGAPDEAAGPTPAQVAGMLACFEPIEADVRRIREQLKHDHAEADLGASLMSTPALAGDPATNPATAEPTPTH
ncbi:MAG: MraY family glycosyltransferase [Planctomycetota bacterium]